LAGCNLLPGNQAIQACEIFIKERLRSPSTYKQIDAEYSGVTFKSDNRDVRMVTIEYDAANAYGTPIRGNQQCVFEINKNGNFAVDPAHAARMSSIGAASDYSPCCLLDEEDKLSNNSDADILREAEAAVNAAQEASDAAEAAANEAAEAAREAMQ